MRNLALIGIDLGRLVMSGDQDGDAQQAKAASGRDGRIN
jgi:hypothetical protein